MKKNIFLYLFVFTGLIALYLFVSSGTLADTMNDKINKLEAEKVILQDSVQQSQLNLLDMQYFSLENNDDALAYYEHLNIKDPARYIADKLLETNEQKGNNPLIPYEGMENDFKLNKIKILNHKWIVVDFSDGKYWGELLIKYELKDDMGVDFTMMDHLLYTRSN
ncbi:hydrolase [Maribacter algarum]|uniref:Hydrolase n=1 Tax=Maribacter algarum (ex Zhang et al. 2020) TaxID=2578118 RepID=A0A5S3PQR5_9FLAO|nr:hydrolase [Maribacter algarum]TMM57034.1 hydrolase [Maribacter algarum]